MTSRSLFSWSPVAALAATLTVVAPVGAQDRLFVAGSHGGDGFEIGAFGRFGEALGPARGLARPLIGGGRFAVVGDAVYDLRTGSARALPAGATAAAYDPARPRVFIVTPASSAPPSEEISTFDVVSGTTSRIVAVPSCSTIFGPRRPEVRYAAGGERLFVERCAAAAGHASDLLVFDLGTSPPAARPTLNGGLPVGARMLPSADGTRLFVGTNVVVAWDTASGQVVALAPPPTTTMTMTWDDARQWLLVATALSPGFDETVSAWTRDLAPVGVATFRATGPCGVRVEASPHTGRIYVTAGGGDSIPSEGLRFAAFGGTPPLLQAQAPLSGGGSTTCEPAVVRTAPGAPRNLRAAVSGNAVSLAWENVGGASSFVLEAGSAPGQTALSVALGVDPHVTFANIPPGTYYVRLRGGNAFGGGRPSQEIQVVVP